MQDRVFANDKIDILWNTEVKAINGTKETGVESVTLYNNKTQEDDRVSRHKASLSRSDIKPNTELFKGVLEMDDVGYLITEGQSTKTNIPGVFACG